MIAVYGFNGGMDYALLVALGIAVVGIGLITVSSAGRDRREVRLGRQLAVVERKLDAVIEHLGVEVGEPVYPEVEEHLDEGATVAAIKAYRERTGAGLLEAKTAVDQRIREREAATSGAGSAALGSAATGSAGSGSDARESGAQGSGAREDALGAADVHEEVPSGREGAFGAADVREDALGAREGALGASEGALGAADVREGGAHEGAAASGLREETARTEADESAELGEPALGEPAPIAAERASVATADTETRSAKS
ncbi:hypothetical protein [Cryptosporangium phraense]|uniref:hypothetical protein n=1 Tax=Cryptosporangium phraense TaxID=2593070 RepID=UPI00197ACFCA|nr:hypothetical protein [Cryptosporangium phraense]